MMLPPPAEGDPAVLTTWLTIKEASQAYRVSPARIRHWLLEGQVAAGRLPTPTGWVWRIVPPPAPALPTADPLALIAALQTEIVGLRAALAACHVTTPPAEDEPDAS